MQYFYAEVRASKLMSGMFSRMLEKKKHTIDHIAEEVLQSWHNPYFEGRQRYQQ